MELLLPVVGVAIMLAGGAGLSVLCLPRGRASSVVEVLSLSILLGAGLISFGSFVVGLVLPGEVVRPVVAALALALAAGGVIALRRRPISFGGMPRLSNGTIAGLTILALQLGLVGFLAWHDWLAFDGLFMWETKAHLACTNGGTIPLEYFADATRKYSHQDYPLFVPLTENWVYAWSGRCGQDLAKILSPLLYVAAAGLLGTSTARFTRSAGAGLLAACLPLLVPSLVFGPGSATSGYADFALATLYLACACYFVEYVRERKRDVLPLIFLLLSLLPWVKQEGAVLYLCFAALVVADAALMRQDRLRVLAGLTVALAPFVAWRVFLLRVGAPSGQDFTSPTVADFFANYARVAESGAWTAGELLHLANWSLLWPLFVLSLVLPRAGFAWRERLAVAMLVLVPLALDIHLYIFSNYGGVTLHVASSMPRLILQLAPVAVLGVALGVPRPGPTTRRARKTSRTAVRGPAESVAIAREPVTGAHSTRA